MGKGSTTENSKGASRESPKRSYTVIKQVLTISLIALVVVLIIQGYKYNFTGFLVV